MDCVFEDLLIEAMAAGAKVLVVVGAALLLHAAYGASQCQRKRPPSLPFPFFRPANG